MTQMTVNVSVWGEWGGTETRTYNMLGQMTRLVAGADVDMEYRYSPTQNNGQITQSKDWKSGEEVTYHLNYAHD